MSHAQKASSAWSRSKAWLRGSLGSAALAAVFFGFTWHGAYVTHHHRHKHLPIYHVPVTTLEIGLALLGVAAVCWMLRGWDLDRLRHYWKRAGAADGAKMLPGVSAKDREHIARHVDK